MQNTDFFAEIANTVIEKRKDFMHEIQAPKDKGPVLNANKIYEKEEQGENIDLPFFDYDKSIKDYYEGIELLKDYYKPFLKRRNKPLEGRKRLYLENFDFRFEEKEDKEDFSRLLNGEGKWEALKIPHYHGPTGHWVSYYRCKFDYELSDKKVYLVLKGSDYITDVYINGRHLVSHEGFFASFEENIGDYLHKKDNVLLIKVENHITALGENKVFGKKLYAATGIGWDEPGSGWHHCPPGGGIFDKVYLEERNESHLFDAYILPDIDKCIANLNLVLQKADQGVSNLKAKVVIEAFNFDDNKKLEKEFPLVANNGLNYYSFDIKMDDPKIWDSQTPYLYTTKIFICQEEDCDQYEFNFGMRKFEQDTKNIPYGTLYLNNQEIILRGANEMGHLQLCVIRNDFDQLIEDILIAKYSNMNYFRITQRPVQREIYEYCDMLGMMVQTDFPLFGQLPKSQIYEAARQVGEMERHIRRHPCVIMVSYINEPTDQIKSNTTHYNLDRKELENWFNIADTFVKQENPQRVIKRVEGDYDPPTIKGMSDFHCYNMWYTNHAISIGNLYKGFLPPIKKDWKTSCGEYGVEGLDNLDLMKKYYPKEWLPKNDYDFWTPDSIARAQTNSMHGDWFYEQDNIVDWIKFGQAHQRKSISLMTLAMRRRSDYIIQTAMHLLIDAYPAGWMKTLVGVDRRPKPSYFAFKDALKPLKLNFRSDRWSAYRNEEISVEAWCLNDTRKDYTNLGFVATLCDSEGRVFAEYESRFSSKSTSSFSFADIKIESKVFENKKRQEIYLVGKIFDGKDLLDEDSFKIDLYERPKNSIKVYPIGNLAKELVSETSIFEKADLDSSQLIMVSDCDELNDFNGFNEFNNNVKGYMNYLDGSPGNKDSLNKKKILYVMNQDLDTLKIGNNSYTLSDKRMWKATYSPINLSIFKDHLWDDLSFLYDQKEDKINFTAEYFVDFEQVDGTEDKQCQPYEQYVFSYKKPLFTESAFGKKEKRSVFMKNQDGYFTSLNLRGRIGVNPALDMILYQALTRD